LHFVPYFANLCQIVFCEDGKCTMATMNISLPDQMKEWVEAQSESGRYSNASDYVRDLIRRDQERSSQSVPSAGFGEQGQIYLSGDAPQFSKIGKPKWTAITAATLEADKGAFVSSDRMHEWLEQAEADPETPLPEPDVILSR